MITQALLHNEVREAGFDGAFKQFKEKGYVVFERVIPRELIGRMHQVWEEYFVPFRKTKPERNRFLMHLPFKAPLYHPMFVENPMVMEIADRVLGKNCLCGYFGSETPLPGAGYMDAHFDLAFWKKLKFLNPPLTFINKLAGSLNYYYGLQVSVPLVDSGPENGPFEIWPATNRFSSKSSGSEVLSMSAGSILVRDIRNLHRGTPHRGNAPRPFLSLVYLRPWVPKWRPPEIPTEIYNSLPERSRRLFRFAAIGQQVPPSEQWAQRSR